MHILVRIGYFLSFLAFDYQGNVLHVTLVLDGYGIFVFDDSAWAEV